MKGLFVQDLLWFKNQKQLFLIYLMLVVLYIFTDMRLFSLAFAPLFFVVIMDKVIVLYLDKSSAAFEFTLPFSRNQFVAEKYLITLIGGALILLVMSLLYGLTGLVSWKELGVGALSSMATIVLTDILMIPLFIKFKNNSNIAAMLIMVALVSLQLVFTDAEGAAMNIVSWLLSHQIWIAVVLILLLAVSWFVSCRFLEREQF